MRHFLTILLFALMGQTVQADTTDDSETEIRKTILDSMLERIKKPDEPNEKPLNATTEFPKPRQPQPFNIEYKVTLNALPTGLKADARLRKHNDRYLFELHARNWVLSYYEKSAFLWNEDHPCDLYTEHYSFNFEGFGHSDAFEINIDQNEKVAHSQTQKGAFEYSVPGNVSDALAYLFKLQCDVSRNQLNPDYRIAYDDGVDHYIFRYVGKEELRTSLGKLDTLVLERVYDNDNLETTYWIAPELDYLMVRMKHKQGKMVTATLKIKELEFLEENKENATAKSHARE